MGLLFKISEMVNLHKGHGLKFYSENGVIPETLLPNKKGFNPIFPNEDY